MKDRNGRTLQVGDWVKIHGSVSSYLKFGKIAYKKVKQNCFGGRSLAAIPYPSARLGEHILLTKRQLEKITKEEAMILKLKGG